MGKQLQLVYYEEKEYIGLRNERLGLRNERFEEWKRTIFLNYKEREYLVLEGEKESLNS